MIRGTRLAIVLAAAALATAEPARAQCSALEVAQMLASDPALNDNFGVSIAVDGDTAVIGAWRDSNNGLTENGAAYIHQRDQGGANNWGFVAKLTASDGASFDNFGWSVDISGNTVVVGAYRHDGVGIDRGAAYVYERNFGGPDSWGEFKKKTAGVIGDQDNLGYAVAVDGDVMILGAYRNDAAGADAGTAVVFGRHQGGAQNWGGVKVLTASDAAAGAEFGRSVAVDGSTIVVGAWQDSNNGNTQNGGAYVFDQALGGPNNWGERAKLTASDGADLDAYGQSCAISGDLVVVGAYRNDGAGLDAGAIYLYERDSGGANNWGELMKRVGSETDAGDNLGWNVDVQGDNVVAGAHLATPRGAGSGEAYVFGRNWGGTDNFGQSHKLSASDAGNNDNFGWSVAVDTEVLAGALRWNGLAANNVGAAYAFSLNGGPVNFCTAGVSASGCQALISTTGVPSATATSGFNITASGVEGAKAGVFFISIYGRQANNWGSSSSFICLVPPVYRGGTLPFVGTTGACDGAFSQDWNALWCSTCPKPAKNPGAGAVIQAQLWYRDPFGTSNQTTALSNAVEVTVCP